MSAPTLETFIHTHVRKASNELIWAGAAMLILGVVALVFPFVSTLVATVFVGWMLVFAGLISVYQAFSIRGAGPFFGALLSGLLSLAAGVFVLARPAGGELAITLTLGAMFMIQGAFEAALAFELRPLKAWGWVLMSALASVVLSVSILAGWPGTSLFALGVLLGVNFVSTGAAYLAVGIAVRQKT
jgi:uncharacterized membrane protein HdeD (DUF308 family)